MTKGGAILVATTNSFPDIRSGDCASLCASVISKKKPMAVACAIFIGMTSPSNHILSMPGAELLVTFANDLLERFAVDNLDLSALGAPDHSQRLEPVGGLRHRGPAYAEHLRQEVLCQRQDVDVRQVLRQQQPAAQALLYAVQGIARGRLLDLDDDRLNALQHESRQAVALLEGSAESRSGDPRGCSWHLDHHARERPPAPQARHAANQAVPADGPRLDRLPMPHHRQE